MSKFYISYVDGTCRIAQGHTLEEAVADALYCCDNLHKAANVLDENFKVLGTTQYLPIDGRYEFKPTQEQA